MRKSEAQGGGRGSGERGGEGCPGDEGGHPPGSAGPGRVAPGAAGASREVAPSFSDAPLDHAAETVGGPQFPGRELSRKGAVKHQLGQEATPDWLHVPYG